MQKAFDGIFESSYAETDAVIAGKELVKGSYSGNATVPASLLSKVKALPEVKAAGGTIAADDANKSEIIGARRQGRRRRGAARPRLGLAYDTAQPAVQPAGAPVRRLGGRPGAGRGRRGHRRGGEASRSATPSRCRRSAAKKPYEITGVATLRRRRLARRRDDGDLRPPTAQALLHKEDVFDGISIQAKDGTYAGRAGQAPSIRSSRRRSRSRTPPQQAEDDAAETNEGMDFIRYFFLGFGAIALFVGSFVIFNTLSITVAQRTREFATLRTLGASRKQVMRSVVLEGLVIGLVASVIGLAAGFGIYKGIDALFVAIGVDLPESGTVVGRADGDRLARARHRRDADRQRHARAAGDPRAADRGGPRGSRAAALAHGRPLGQARGRRDRRLDRCDLGRRVRQRDQRRGDRRCSSALGVLALFVGVALAAPTAREADHAPRRLAGAARRRGRRAGGRERGPQPEPDRVDRRRADDRPHAGHRRRRARRRAAVVRRGRGQRPGRGRIHPRRQATASRSAPPRARSSPRSTGVKTVSHVRYDSALVDGEESDVTGIDPATIGSFYKFDWVKGSDEKVVASLGADDGDRGQVLRRRQEGRGRRVDLALESAVRQTSGRSSCAASTIRREIDQMLGDGLDHPAGVRRLVPAGQEPVHVHRRRPGRRRPRSSRRRTGSATPRSTRARSSRRTT